MGNNSSSTSSSNLQIEWTTVATWGWYKNLGSHAYPIWETKGLLQVQKPIWVLKQPWYMPNIRYRIYNQEMEQAIEPILQKLSDQMDNIINVLESKISWSWQFPSWTGKYVEHHDEKTNSTKAEIQWTFQDRKLSEYPLIRRRVYEALQDILGQPHSYSLDFKTDCPVLQKLPLPTWKPNSSVETWDIEKLECNDPIPFPFFEFRFHRSRVVPVGSQGSGSWDPGVP